MSRVFDKDTLKFIVSNDKFKMIKSEIALNEDYFEVFREGLRARKTRLVYDNHYKHSISLE